MNTYIHTQPGVTIVRSMIVMMLIFLIASAFLHQLLIATAAIAITTWVFRSMTIEISDADLTWYFGSGFPRRRVSLNDVVSAEPVRTTVWDGWGIHYTRRGWLFNVSGREAVCIALRNGKRFCLGTDEPEELAKLLVKKAQAVADDSRRL